MLIIDAHLHLWRKIDGRLGDKKVKPLRFGMVDVAGKKIQGMPTWFKDGKNPAELALAAFDDAGIAAGIVTQEYLDGNQNDYLLEVKKVYPRRFFMHGLLDFYHPEKLKKAFDKTVRQGFRGIKCPAMFLPSAQNPIRLDQPKLMAVWEAMQSSGMVFSIDLAEGDAQVRQMKNILRSFPRLKVAVGHFGMVSRGNWMAQIRLAEYENVYIECGGIIWLFRREGPPFRKAQQCIKQAVQAVGAEKIMWGSDYPRTMLDFTYRQSLEFALSGCEFLTERERAAFLGQNAAKLYGLQTPERKPHVRITEGD